MARLGVLMVRVKAGCSFEVVSSVSGKFGDHYSTKVPSSSVSKEVSRNGVPGDLSSEGLVLLARRARFLSYVHSVWQAWHFAHAAKPLAGVAHMRRGFGSHLTRQAEYLVNLDHVLKGSKVSFCETVVGFHLGHDDDSV